MVQMSLVSIIIPVYFNASSLPALSRRLILLADSAPEDRFEFIYVDDGSQDESYDVLCALAAQDARIRVIKLVRNFGSNVAILAGMKYAQGDCVGFIAADLQDPPELLPDMIRLWEQGAPVVLAVRKDRHGDPWLTRLFAGWFNWLFKKLVFKGFSPQGIGFFVIDRRVTNTLLECEERNPHLIGLILWAGYPYQLVEYERVEREHGQSRWTFGKKVKYFIDAFAAFSYLPLRISSMLGLSIAGLGGIYALIIIIMRVFNLVTVQGWATLMAVVLIISGVQLVMLGIMGEYLWRNLDATRKRPMFIIERMIEYPTGQHHDISSKSISHHEERAIS